MGLKGFDFKSAQDVWDDMRVCTPNMFGATYEKMEKPESIHWPCATIEHAGTPILHIGKFSSADGLGTFYGIESRQPAEVADGAYPFTLMTGRLNIAEGEKIKLSSRRGEVQALARLTTDVAPGVLYMTMHFGTGSVNNLTNTAMDPLSKMPELKHSAVKVEKIVGAN